MKTKVIHIALATGGVKTYVSHVLEYSRTDLFEFIVVAPANTLFQEYCAAKNIRYYTVDLDRNSNPFKDLQVLWRIISIIKKEKPDLVHTHSARAGFLGRLACRITRCKVIYTPHAFSFLPFTGIKRIVFYLLEYIARSWTSLLLAISYSEANIAIYELGYAKDKVSVILNSIPLKERTTAGLSRSNLQIGMIGRLVSQKNPLQFLEIARCIVSRYSHVNFVILGAGIHDDLQTDIDKFIKQNQLARRVKIENWGNAVRSSEFLQQTDIYVMTSIFEGLSFSLLEAMLLKVPCVVSKVTGNIDVIQNNENGFSCLGPDEFCEKISLLIENPQLRKAIGEAGHQYITQKHNIEKNITQLENFYLKIYDK